MMLSGWGRYPRAECRVIEPDGAAETLAAISGNDSLIARGNGRSYGDSSLNPEATVSTRRENRFIAFDPATGVLTCEAGAMLSDILATFVPRGWFPPVTPGTKFVTVGGMIAADVHGKNHHKAGAFGDHVEWLDLALADGQVLRCSAAENAELFAATRGGMGLTGIILAVCFRMTPIETASIRQETLRAGDLAETMDLFEQSRDWTYTVAWIDCLAKGGGLGRSLLYRGEHARLAELPAEHREAPLALKPPRSKRVPLDFPAASLNRWSVGVFNELYYRRSKPGTVLVDLETFFYPLDAILEWNRIYGRSGLLQYQCVLPKAESAAGLRALLSRIAATGAGSFLSVLKLLGPQAGVLSFPLEGYTLALDFRAGAATLALLAELDAIVAAHGGRIYLAKDARMDAAMMRKTYPRLAEFESLRRRVDPQGKFASLQSRRLAL
ncbi:MAG TPA: FAD-binding oxidoreductase [Stellaceae bacterium]|nr:FAD-binding oxidoreductase [Stellaceae bacterium]